MTHPDMDEYSLSENINIRELVVMFEIKTVIYTQNERYVK